MALSVRKPTANCELSQGAGSPAKRGVRCAVFVGAAKSNTIGPLALVTNSRSRDRVELVRPLPRNLNGMLMVLLVELLNHCTLHPDPVLPKILASSTSEGTKISDGSEEVAPTV